MKHRLASICSHPFIIIALFLATVLFVAVLAYINFTYQLAIAGNIQVIMGTLQNANYDDEAIKAGLPFISGIADVLANYEQLISNVWRLVLLQIAAFLAVGLWRWSLIHYLFTEENILYTWAHLVLRSLVFLAPLLVIDYLFITSLLRRTVEGTGFSTASLYIILGITFFAFYFLFVCLALPRRTLKENIRLAFVLGMKKAHYVLPVLLIGWGLIAASAYLVSLAAEGAFFAMALSVALFFIVMTLVQLVFVAVVQEAV